MSSTSFSELDRSLRRAGAHIDAPECHGALCGALCAPGSDTDVWIAHTLDGLDANDTVVREVRRELETMAATLHRRLREGDLSFEPLLPDDEAPLADRAAALGEWCEGFLFGAGSARIEQFDRLPDTAQEVFRDLVEIARVGVPVDGDESDEAAYYELVEYLRAGTQLVFDELNPAPEATEVTGPDTVQ